MSDLRCPTCGAPLPPPAAMQFTCSYCHAVLAISAQPEAAAGVETVLRLHSAGRGKIMAIKAVRELTGLGLKEAKDLVEGPMPVDLRATRRGHSFPLALADLQAAGAQYEVLGAQAPPREPARETASLGEPRALRVALVRVGPNKIAVIKAIREVTGLGLADSKDLCDRAPSAFSARPDLTEARILRAFADAGASVRVER
jgi:large subunit ribosomal protein L7/L12